ncbi:MAG TPA: tetratricopeptide repeat protein, partial [Gemmatimonadaceae bacterium]
CPHLLSDGSATRSFVVDAIFPNVSASLRVLIAGLLVVFATPVAAQTRCAVCVARADSTFIRGDAMASLQWALPGLRQDSNDVELLWRAARAETVMGIVEGEREVIEAHYDRAVAYARRAVALAPNDAIAHFWLAAVLGRRALRSGFRGGIAYASESYHEAQRTLALDSMNAGGHEIVGKLNSEVRKLPWVVRELAAVLTDLPVAKTASWEEAERQLKRAIALDPTLMVARVDLSQLYLRMGRRAEAVRVVEEIEKMPRRSPADAYFQGEARKRLSWYP